ncbi:MAG: xanthine dehydrogenase family protein subunit M [Anaerolineaceae bacterium]|nr:MAG: xanthine dehydrogenase family protein subunit M [Anaerolineaceae bacterium]
MWKQYFTPNTLSDALQLIEQYHGRAQIIAGGTDLVLDFSSNKYPSVEALIDISSIPELRKITLEDRVVSIGSAVTLSEIIHSDELKSHTAVLVDAARHIAGPQIRNIATIGGNVVNASPAADMVPALLVLGSMVSITSYKREVREIHLSEFLLGNRKVGLQAGEIVTGFHFTLPDHAVRYYFRKVQPRQSMAIAILNLAILLKVEINRIVDVRIAIGAAAPTAVRIKTVEKELINLPVKLAANPKLYAGVIHDISPISDFRASKKYRLCVAKNLLHEAIVELLHLSEERSLEELPHEA